MATKKTTKLSDKAALTTATGDQMIPVVSADGTVNNISLTNLAQVVAGLVTPDVRNEGVFIMYHRNNDNVPLMVKPGMWDSLQNSGEIAEGVAVVEGGKILVVAPTEADSAGLLWSNADVDGGGTTTTDRITALNDWNGKANTTAQIKHAECSGTAYAPGFCANYSRVNANSIGLSAGTWWLPSLGELMMISANLQRINYALSFIKNSTKIEANAFHWSSTEGSVKKAWNFSFANNSIACNISKYERKFRVRPVSEFI